MGCPGIRGDPDTAAARREHGGGVAPPVREGPPADRGRRRGQRRCRRADTVGRDEC